MLDGLPWEIALLQEAPPRWLAPLGRACRANGALGLTSRNELPWLRAAIADRFPDLIKSGEGGSNMTLVRAPARIEAVERHRLALRPSAARCCSPGSPRRGARRLAVANMHLSVPSTGQGPDEVLRAAELAVAFAGGDPLMLGGDLNLRPSQHAARLRGARAALRPGGADRAEGDRPPAGARARRWSRSHGPLSIGWPGRCGSPTTLPSPPRSA